MPLLVGGVQAGELREHVRVGVGALLGRRARGEPGALADRGMRGEDLALLVRGKLVDERARTDERVGLGGEPLDEARPALEELGELLGAQLPR